MSWNEAKRWLHNFRNQNSTSSFSSSRTLLVTLPLRRCTNIPSYITWFNREKLFKCSLLLHTLSTMNKCWFLSPSSSIFSKDLRIEIGKNIRKEGRREKRWRGKVWHNIKKKRSTMQRDSLISFYAFYLLVLVSIGDRCSHRYLHIYRVFGFVLFNLSACGPERIVASSPLFLSICFSFFIPLRVYCSIFLEKWKNKRGRRSETGVRRGKALWEE